MPGKIFCPHCFTALEGDPGQELDRTTLSKENQDKVNKAIEKGVTYLKDNQLGNGTWADNRYFLWSVERVALLYNLKTIGGEDWYSWAAHMFVTNQREEGSWWIGGRAGPAGAGPWGGVMA